MQCKRQRSKQVAPLGLQLTFCLYVLSVLLAASPRVLSGPTSHPVVTAADLSRRVDELDVPDMTLEAAIELLARKTQSNIVVLWQELEPHCVSRHTRIHLHLWNTTVGQAISALLALGDEFGDASYGARDGLILVGPREWLQNSTVTRVYDVNDLIERLLQYQRRHPPIPVPTPTTQPTQPAPTTRGVPFLIPSREYITVEDAAVQLEDTIEQTVDSDSWQQNGGSSGVVQIFAGRFVIKQTPENQARIVTLLRTLRAAGNKEGAELNLDEIRQHQN